MRMLRLYKINKVILQHGLEDILPKRFLPWYVKLARHSLFWIRNQHKQESPGKRIRLALQSLGPVFIKFGQMLSTRRDLLSQDIADELAFLQDKVEPFDPKLAKQIIKDALQISELDLLFEHFESTPLASASIAQVHSAVLKSNGQPIVIKVLRPDIKDTIHADIDLLHTLASGIQQWLPDGKRLRPIEVVNEYRKTIFDELDLLRECANGIQLGKNFTDSPALYIPHIYREHCRQNVLVMERINAVPVSDINALQAQNTDLKTLAERGVEVFFTQVFRDSFFHADMHPGNIFVSRDTPEDPQYIAIDFGIVGTLNREDKRYLAENFIAFFNSDYRKVAQLHADSGWVPSDTNIDEFELAIRAVCEPIFEKPLAEISFGQVLLQLFSTARRFNMTLQPQLVLLQKTLLYVEGLGRQLYPQLDLWKTAKPFLENWMKEQIGLSVMLKKIQRNLPFWSEKLPDMPDLLHDSLRQLKTLPDLQKSQFEQQMYLQQRHHNAKMAINIGATFLILSVLMPLHSEHWWPSLLLGACAIPFWFYAITRSRKI